MAKSRLPPDVSSKVNDYIKKQGPKCTTVEELLDKIREKFEVGPEDLTWTALMQRIQNHSVDIGSQLKVVKPSKAPEKVPVARTEELIEFDKRVGKLSFEQSSLKKKYKIVLAANERLEAELAAALLIRDNKQTFSIKPRASQRDSEATAVVVLSDWHVEEEVKSSSVNGLNKYNLDIAKIRATECFERIVRLVKKEQQDVIISELVLGLLGDFISGYLREEDREKNLLQPMDAALYAQSLLVSGIDFLLEHTKLKLTCVCKVGNHGRTTHKIHMATESGNSLETMIYHALAKHYSESKYKERIRFIIDDGYHTLLEVYEHMIRFHHGHAINFHGGVGGLTVPANRVIAGWNKEQPAYMDVFGHLHTYTPMPKLTCNGSLIGYSSFAIYKGFGFEVPLQALFLIDKKRGKTVTMPILFSC